MHLAIMVMILEFNTGFRMVRFCKWIGFIEVLGCIMGQILWALWCFWAILIGSCLDFEPGLNGHKTGSKKSP